MSRSVSVPASVGLVLYQLASQGRHISDLIRFLNEVRKDLVLARDDLRRANRDRPTRNENETESRWLVRLAAWQRRVGDAEDRVQRINERLEDASAKIERAEVQLKRMETCDLPHARRQDAEDARRRLEAAKRDIEMLAEDVADDDDGLRLKVEVVKREIRVAQNEDAETLSLRIPRFRVSWGSDADALRALGAQVAASRTDIADDLSTTQHAARAAELTRSGVRQVVLADDTPEQAHDDAVLARVSADARMELCGLRSGFGALVRQEVAGTAASQGAQSVYSDLQARWAGFLARQQVTDHIDVNALVQWVTREAYLANTADLRFYAQKVKFFNDLKKIIRREITRAREHLSRELEYNPNAKSDSPLSDPYDGVLIPKDPVLVDGRYVPFDPRDSDGVSLAEVGKTLYTKDELDKYISQLEEDLNSVGDDAQLANVDLQNMMQRQQQTLQLMSNLSKMLHDTAMAIIRKIGG